MFLFCCWNWFLLLFLHCNYKMILLISIMFSNLWSLFITLLFYLSRNVFDPRQMRISVQGSGVYINRERGYRYQLHPVVLYAATFVWFGFVPMFSPLFFIDDLIFNVVALIQFTLTILFFQQITWEGTAFGYINVSRSACYCRYLRTYTLLCG